MFRPYYLAFLLLIVCTSLDAETVAQATNKGNDLIPPPTEEKFEPADGIIAPFWDTWCGLNQKDYEIGNCTRPKLLKRSDYTKVSLFDSDGTVWWSFALNNSSPEYFRKNPKLNFEPFSVYPKAYPDTVLLRLVSESKNWYEVEINETTRETKFVWQGDPGWSRTRWSFWFHEGYRSENLNVYLPENHKPLLDKPDGVPVEKASNGQFKRVRVVKVEGDWLYVEGIIHLYTGGTVNGWVRWRDGRKILVGCRLNDFKVPE